MQSQSRFATKPKNAYHTLLRNTTMNSRCYGNFSKASPQIIYIYRRTYTYMELFENIHNRSFI
jgi:hypothetical protein